MNKVSDTVVTQTVLEKALEKQSNNIIEDIGKVIGDFAQQVDARFESLEFRMNARFEKLETRMEKLENSMNNLINTIDGLIKRIDDYEKENIARDRHIARLEAWVQQIADETGVKLKSSF